jgi:dolichol-phosphate mannosyltransferase
MATIANNHQATEPNTLLYSIVIPMYNEAKNIVPTLESLAVALRDESIPFEFVVVNDNSRDETLSVLEGVKGDFPELNIVSKGAPSGLGRAVRCGLQNVTGDVVAVVMADCSDHPADVVRSYRAIEEGHDCVFGSRFMKGGEVSNYPFVKLIINRLANYIMQVLFMTHHDDLTNAFKVYRRHVIDAITPLHAAHFNITIEMSLSALIRRYRIARIPFRWSGRTWGQSNLRINEMGRRYLCTMLKIWFERLLILDDLLDERSGDSGD